MVSYSEVQLVHICHIGIYLSPSIILSFFRLLRLLFGERPDTKLSRWGTLMGQSWLSRLSAYMHAMQTMRPFIRVASVSELERHGWGLKFGKAVTDTGRWCVFVCVHFPPHACACMCVSEVWSGCSYPCSFSSTNQSLPIRSSSSETVFLCHMVSHRYTEKHTSQSETSVCCRHTPAYKTGETTRCGPR